MRAARRRITHRVGEGKEKKKEKEEALPVFVREKKTEGEKGGGDVGAKTEHRRSGTVDPVLQHTQGRIYSSILSWGGKRKKRRESLRYSPRHSHYEKKKERLHSISPEGGETSPSRAALREPGKKKKGKSPPFSTGKFLSSIWKRGGKKGKLLSLEPAPPLTLSLTPSAKRGDLSILSEG